MTRSLPTVSTVRPFAASAAAIVIALAVPLAAAPAVHAADAVPYTDPRAKGVLGLCDTDGKAVTSGSVSERPFVWRAVSSVAAPEVYAAKGRTATLYAFQPRKGVDPQYWSGDLLTASATYSNPKHPMAAATVKDEPLATNLDAYPAGWDGYYQLRIYLSVPGQPAYRDTYAATDIKVDGTKWTVVRGGNVDCASGTAVSSETKILGVDADPSASAPASSGAPATGSAAPTQGAADVTSSAAPSAAVDGNSATSASAASSSDGSNSLPLIAALLLVVAALGGGAAYFWRRRTGATP